MYSMLLLLLFWVTFAFPSSIVSQSNPNKNFIGKNFHFHELSAAVDLPTLSPTITPSDIILPESEYTALYDLYTSLNGTYWSYFVSYLTIGHNPWEFNVSSATHPNPCYQDWIGLACNCSTVTKTCHVTIIDLPHTNLEGVIPDTIQNFTYMTKFDIKNNSVYGQIPSTVGNLFYLEELNVQNNYVTGEIPPSLWNCQKMERIYASFNKLSGTIPSFLFNFPKITRLQFAFNNLTGTIPDNIGNAGTLEVLFLLKNNLTGTIPEEIGQLKSLLTFSLGVNSLTGSIPSSIGQLTRCTSLELHNNSLVGPIPATISNMTYLSFITLQGNFLYGTIPESLYSLKFLSNLQLNGNYFNGTISAKVGQLKRLVTMILTYNNFAGTIPPEITTLPRLTSLSFSLNFFTGKIPETIGNLQNLLYFQSYYTFLTGSIPPSIATISGLRFLYLQFNHLSGSLPEKFGALTNLVQLDISGNRLTGTLPKSFVNLTLLHDFSMSSNLMHGSVMDRIPDSKLMTYLIMDHNQFTGELPSPSRYIGGDLSSNDANGLSTSTKHNGTWKLGDWKLLYEYEVENNYFTGTFFTSLANSTGLQILNLGNNYVTGTVPTWIDAFAYLQECILAYNLLSGTVPYFVKPLKSLQTFQLNNNFMSGSVPNIVANFPQLVELQLQYNRLSGTLPGILINTTNLELLFLQHNQFTGPLFADVHFRDTVFAEYADARTKAWIETTQNGAIPSESQEENSITPDGSTKVLPYSLTNIDVSNNQLTGTIPSRVFALPQLKSFAAVSNCLHGSIPTVICQAKGLTGLALDGLSTSKNCRQYIFPALKDHYHYLLNAFTLSIYIEGSIPSCLFTLPALESLHLSGNGLTGTLSSSLSISSKLSDLTLSHNQLYGTIPYVIQQHNWANLDLSYNKLSGRLINDFQISYNQSYHQSSNDTDDHVPYTQNGNQLSLTLDVNRLSGGIPSQLFSLRNISILDGNIFACDLARDNLPQNDPKYGVYTCGSDSVNTAIIIWMFFVCVPVLITFLFLVYYGDYVLMNFIEITQRLSTQQAESEYTIERLSIMEYLRNSQINAQRPSLYGNNNKPPAELLMTTNPSTTTDRISGMASTTQQSISNFINTTRQSLLGGMTASLSDKVKADTAVTPAVVLDDVGVDISTTDEGIHGDGGGGVALTVIRSSTSSRPSMVSIPSQTNPSISSSKSNKTTTNPNPTTNHNNNNKHTEEEENNAEEVEEVEEDATTSLRESAQQKHQAQQRNTFTRPSHYMNRITSEKFRDTSPSLGYPRNASFSPIKPETMYQKCLFFYHQIQIWRNYLLIIDERQKRYSTRYGRTTPIYFFAYFVRTMRRIFCIFTIILVCIYMPLYTIISVYESTYYDDYAWIVSAMLLSGVSAGVFIAIAFVVFVIIAIICFEYFLFKLFRKWKESRKVANEFSNWRLIMGRILLGCVNFWVMILVDVAYVSVYLDGNAVTVFFAQLCLAMFKLLWNEFVLWRSLFVLKDGLVLKWWLRTFYAHDEAYIESVLIANGLAFTPSIGATTATTAVGENEPPQALEEESPPVEPTTANNTRDTIEDRKYYKNTFTSSPPSIRGSDVGSTTSSSAQLQQFLSTNHYYIPTTKDIINFTVLNAINNILIPCLAIAIVDPNCYYNALYRAPSVSGSYSYDTCGEYFILAFTAFCVKYNDASQSTSYDPPFIYGFQCSSYLAINYIPVYIFMFTMIGILLPCSKLVSKFCYDHIPTDHWCYPLIARMVPMSLKPLKPSPGEHDPPLFEKHRFIVRINTFLMILLCFGVVFPLLAMIICVSAVINTAYEEIVMGKILLQANELGFTWYRKQLELECDNIAESFSITLWIFIGLACLFYGYLVFDTFGDTVGWKGGMPPALIIICLPLLIAGCTYLTRNIYQWSGLHRLFPKRNISNMTSPMTNNNTGAGSMMNKKSFSMARRTTFQDAQAPMSEYHGEEESEEDGEVSGGGESSLERSDDFEMEQREPSFFDMLPSDMVYRPSRFTFAPSNADWKVDVENPLNHGTNANTNNNRLSVKGGTTSTKKRTTLT